jgi:hypothetical protein
MNPITQDPARRPVPEGAAPANNHPQLGRGQDGAFRQMLTQQAAAVPTAESAAKAHAKIEKAAGDLVANALILPVMKQIRRSPWGENSVFSGGNGEKTFGPAFDMEIADRLAHSPRMGATQALVARLEKKPAAKPSTSSGKLDLHG